MEYDNFSTNDILLKIIEKSSQLYPDSTTKKAMINAKNLYKRLLSAFTLEQLLNSTSEILDFCGNIPARLEFIHALFEIFDKGDDTFRNEALSLVKRSKTAMKMTKEMMEQGFKIHLGCTVNRLVYDLLIVNPQNIFEEFERMFMQ